MHNSSPMNLARCLVIAHSAGFQGGGANRSLCSTLEALASNGYHVTVLVPPNTESNSVFLNAGADRIVNTDVLWNSVCMPHSLSPSHALRCKLGRARRMLTYSQTIKKYSRMLLSKIDRGTSVVYTNCSVTDLGQLISNLLQVPHLWHLREFGDVDYNYFPLRGKKKHRQFLSSATATISVSYAVQQHFGLARESDFVVYNGVLPISEIEELKNTRLETARGFSGKFLMLGTLHPAKGQLDGIRAFARFLTDPCAPKTSTLSIVGPGDPTPLAKESIVLGVQDQVNFTGYSSTPISHLLSSDVLLMCSRSEGFGRVTVEAMSAGTIVIGRNTGATPELISDMHNGLLYDGSVFHLASCMRTVTENIHLRHKIRSNAWNDAAQLYSRERYSHEILKIFDKYASGPCSRQ